MLDRVGPKRVHPLPVSETGHLNTGSETGTLLGQKYEDGASKLLASSVGLGWGDMVTAELRRHRALRGAGFVQPVNEIAIAVSGQAQIRRRSGLVEQYFMSDPGVACVCPRGVSVRYLNITGDYLDMLHLYYPKDMIGAMGAQNDSTEDAGLVYTGGIRDPLVQTIGMTIAEELRAGEQCNRMLVESLGVALSARILQGYTRRNDWIRSEAYNDAIKSTGLDPQRLQRVSDFIADNIAEDISLNDLSNVSCLSPFHFSRAFKASTGASPIQFLSNLRMIRTKELLASTRHSVDAIALQVGYASGASLSRAFKKLTGTSPARYRNQRRSWQHPAPNSSEQDE